MATYLGWQAACRAAIRAGGTNEAATAAFVAELAAKGEAVHAATLRRWHKLYRKTGGLFDRRWENEGVKNAAADPMRAECRRLWKTQNKLSMRLCYQIAKAKAADQGWEVCSYATIARHLAAMPAGERIFAREGPDAFTAKAEPSLERDYSTLESNEIWCADHHLCDVIVCVEERVNAATGEVMPVYARPWLTAWQDVRSRKIVGWVVRARDPDTGVILEAFYMGASSHGLPDTAYTDNGKDFDARVLTGETKAMRWKRRRVHVWHDQERMGGIYANLQIRHVHAWPYHGQSKPIERFFGTLESRFGRTLETYCGRNPQEKPEQLQAKMESGKAPPLQEFIAKFGRWLETDYHQNIHTGDAMDCAPNVAWEHNLVTKRTAPDADLKLFLQPRIGPLKVGKNGVCYKGMRYGQFQLGQLLEREVFIRVDGADISPVSVWSADDKSLGVAHCNRKIPFNLTHSDLSGAIAEKKRRSKILKGAHEARLRIAEDVTDIAIQAAAVRNQTASPVRVKPENPYSIAAVRSHLAANLAAATEAAGDTRDLRRAVGAELLTLDDFEAIYGRE